MNKDSKKENRPLSKLAYAEEFEGDTEHRTGVYKNAHEDSSTGSLSQSPAEVEFQKRSNNDSLDDDIPDPFLESEDRKMANTPVPKSKLALGIKIAHIIATIASLGVTIAGAVIQGMRGDFSHIKKLLKLVVALTFKISTLTLPNFLQNLREKITNKLKKTKLGRVAVTFISTAWKTITSKPAKRSYKLIMTILALAASPTPLGIAIGAISLTAIVYGVVKDCLEVRTDKRLKLEKTLLGQNKQLHREQVKLLHDAKRSAPDNPGFKNFLLTYYKSLNVNAGKKDDITNQVKNNKTKEFLRASRDNLLEGAATIMACIDGSYLEKTSAAISILGGLAGEANGNLTKKQQRQLTKDEINNLKPHTPSYKNLEELKEISRKQEIEHETLQRFLKVDSINKLDSVELEQQFAKIRNEVKKEEKYAAPIEKSLFQKFTSSLKAGFGYFKESQLQKVIDLYTPKQAKATIDQQNFPGENSLSLSHNREISKEQGLSPEHLKIPEKDMKSVSQIHQNLEKQHLLDQVKHGERSSVYSEHNKQEELSVTPK